MRRYKADIKINVTVYFEDNGMDDLYDQAMDSLRHLTGTDIIMDGEYDIYKPEEVN